jgi:hypothetical protein
VSVISTIEPMLYEGLRNGMSLKQVKVRMPVLAARKLGITVADFHRLLEDEAGPADRELNALADRVVALFSPTEQRKIALRK